MLTQARPVEMLKVSLKPVNFFTKNPSMDVPPSRQESNRSQLVSRNGVVNGHVNGHVNGQVNGQAHCCSGTS